MPNDKPKVHRPGVREQLFFFISGAIISVPFPILAYSILSHYLTPTFSSSMLTFILVVLTAPLLEEFAKAYPLFFRHGETEKSLVTLGFLTGLGFGITEFILYVFVLHTPAMIRLPALLFHATNTMIVAYGISKNKSFRYYLIAVLLHFLNNYSALYGTFWIYGGFGAAILSYVTAGYLNLRAREEA